MKLRSDPKSYTISAYKYLVLPYPTASHNCQQVRPCTESTTTMEHLKALLLTSPSALPVSSIPTEHCCCLRAPYLQWHHKQSSRISSIPRKAVKRAPSPSPLLSTLPPSKRCHSLVTPAASSILTPSSSISSSLTFSSPGSYHSNFGSNQAIINQVLYGKTPTSIVFPSSLTTSNMGLCHFLIPEVLQLQE
jgi:hypothetical protein